MGESSVPETATKTIADMVRKGGSWALIAVASAGWIYYLDRESRAERIATELAYRTERAAIEASYRAERHEERASHQAAMEAIGTALREVARDCAAKCSSRGER